jgi:hypothetical protein
MPLLSLPRTTNNELCANHFAIAGNLRHFHSNYSQFFQNQFTNDVHTSHAKHFSRNEASTLVGLYAEYPNGTIRIVFVWKNLQMRHSDATQMK